MSAKVKQPRQLVYSVIASYFNIQISRFW